MASVETIKDSMRIVNSRNDNQIGRDIDACLSDLKMKGINSEKNDPLIDKAIEFYCKADLDYQGQSERYWKSYDNLTAAMQACSDYKL